MIPPIEKDIFRTLAFFSYFNYPLTSFELWKWQLNPIKKWSYSEIIEALQQPIWLRNFATEEDGFWSIYWKTTPIREQIADRHQRFINALSKYRRLQWLVKYLRRLPWIEGLAVCNSLSWHHTEPRSDIDLFLIVRPGYVWTSRLWSVTPLALLRQRPGERGTDPIDLSFFVTNAGMNLEPIQISSTDPYLALWTKSIIPIFGSKRVWQMWQSENRWVERILPAASWRKPSSRLRFSKKNSWPIFGHESSARTLQLKRLPEELRKLANVDSRVIVADHQLKFHKNDRREDIKQRLEEAMKLCET